MLTGVFSQQLSISPDNLKKALNRAASNIFNQRPKNMGPVHALMLQLVANGIIRLGVSDSNKVGTNKLTTKDVELKLATTTYDGIVQPAQMVPSM